MKNTATKQERQFTLKERRARSRRGMTLVEIMIVLAIIAGLMVAVAFAAFPAIDRSRVAITKIKVNKVKGEAINYYANESPGQLPDELVDLVEPPSGSAPYLNEDDLVDEWNHDLGYNKESERKFEVRSRGIDGEEGNDDDIVARSDD